MKKQMLECDDRLSQMEPMVIDESCPLFAELLGLAHELCLASARLDSQIHKQTARGVAELISGVNCYYSNLIEGQRASLTDINDVMRDTAHLGSDRKHRNLAFAHISADRWANSQRLTQANLIFFLQETHRLFCEYLPVDMLTLEDCSVMVPGEFRRKEVRVGRHLPPRSEHLSIFLNHYSEVYGQRLESADKGGITRLTSIVAVFAAHHRLVWIHPFADGNGRVARITLDAMLRACGVTGTALWSMSRGLAKSADTYNSLLAQADKPRYGDRDGCGNLTERGLAEFCRFGLQAGIDQARFMASMIDLDSFGERVHNYFRRVRQSTLRPESAYLYMHAWTMGKFERGDATRLTGLSERTARTILSKLLAEGFLVSDTPKGSVRIGLPVHAMSFLLPNLYPHGCMAGLLRGWQSYGTGCRNAKSQDA